jgi:glycosyltransferase involved in cell wall biosynthesis
VVQNETQKAKGFCGGLIVFDHMCLGYPLKHQVNQKYHSEALGQNKMFNPLVSIIINNYNYGRYIGNAIDSALLQSYSNIEVIVVDDGSTDDSQALIKEYDGRIRSIFKNNGGQASAYNVGFAASNGEIVTFLDADDILRTDTIYYVVDRFKDGDIVKVQFQLEIIDNEGKPSGIYIPAGHMPNGAVLDILLRYGGYGSPPASGNVYRRTVLRKIMPIPESNWRIAADSVPSLASPFFGHVGSIDKVLGYYRVHQNVRGHGDNKNLSRPGNAASLGGKIEEFLKAEEYLKELCVKYQKKMQANMIYKNPSMLKTVLSFKVLDPNHPYNRKYNVGKLVLLGINASIRFPLYSIFHKLSIVIWFLLVAICPSSIQKKLIMLGLQPSMRCVNLK